MKKFLAVMLALTMLVGLTAVGASAEGGKTTVVFWNSWTGGDGEALQALVTKFNEISAICCRLPFPRRKRLT